MTNGQEVESILAIDGGSVATKAILLDQVEGSYRFVAKGEGVGAMASPGDGLLCGLRDALLQIEKVTGRVLLGKQGRPLVPEQGDGHGVDAIVASTSAFPPLRVVVAGLIHNLSVESARRAVESSCATVVDTVALNEGGQRWGTTRGIEARLETLCQNPPDAIVLVGGVDGGASSPLVDISQMLVAVASVLDVSKRPSVIFAGNQDARSAVAELLANRFEFRAVDNVRPRLDVEVLTGIQQELERLYRERGARHLPQLDALSAWSAAPLLSSRESFDLVVRFVARQYGLSHGVLGVDIGASNTQVFASHGDSHCGLVKSDVGVGVGLEKLLDEVPIERIVRWLPYRIGASDARNRLLNKALHPLSLPQIREGLYLEQAAAREAMALALQVFRSRWLSLTESQTLLPRFDLVIGGGGVLAKAPTPGQAALMLLDALQPVGLTRLAIDHLSMLPALGAVARLQPLATAQVIDQDGLLELGTVVVPLGVAREGEMALKFHMVYGEGSAIEVEVPYGSLEVIPLPLGRTAILELFPTRKFDIGLGQGERSAKIEVKGGAVGVIIDARGRPLPFAPELEAQQAKMQEWLWSIGG